MDTHLETLATWVDGEPVSHADVTRALGTAEGRDYVVDLMALRRLVARTTPGFGSPPVAARPRRWPILAGAAAAFVCVAGGFVAGRLASTQEAGPGATVAPASITELHSAPAPTRIIRLKDGVDWRETSGGD